MSRHSQEALANLGLKHALEDLLLAFEDREAIPQGRVMTVTNGLIEYLDEAVNGEQIAQRRAFLLKHDEKRALREFDRLKGILGKEDVKTTVESISKTLRDFSSKQPLDTIEMEFTLELLKKFLRSVRLVATPTFPNVPQKISSLR